MKGPDWDKINSQWGEILAAARKNESMHQDLMFDDVGALVTSQRPMIESLIADRTIKSHRVLFYLAMLGFHHAPGRILKVSVGDRVRPRASGKQEKVNRGKR